MHPRQFAWIGGLVLLVFGVVSFLPGLSTSPADAGLPILNVEASYGLFLGFFPMNIFNKLVILAFGFAGVYSANRPTTSLPASINFSRWLFGVSGVAVVLGLFPATNTLFGYWPLFGGDIVLHAVMAVAGLYFGVVLAARAMEENHRRFPKDQDARKAS